MKIHTCSLHVIITYKTGTDTDIDNVIQVHVCNKLVYCWLLVVDCWGYLYDSIGPLTAEPLNLKFTIINTIDTSVYAT